MTEPHVATSGLHVRGVDPLGAPWAGHVRGMEKVKVTGMLGGCEALTEDTREVVLPRESMTYFADELAARKPTPGGGGAAAYVGALGAALASMAGHFTLGKPRYADVEDDVRRLLGEAEEVRCALLDLVDEDARAFQRVTSALSIPRGNPRRAGALEAATRGACEPPLTMMDCTTEVIGILEELHHKCSRLLLTDVGCAAVLCSASLRAASLNVYVNTRSLSDRAAARELDGRCDALLAKWVGRADVLAEGITADVRGES